jgi:hypothetical protein
VPIQQALEANPIIRVSHGTTFVLHQKTSVSEGVNLALGHELKE